MPEKDRLILEFLKKRNLSLNEYHDYLALLSEKPYDKLTQQLREKKLDILEYKIYLASQQASQISEETRPNSIPLHEAETALIEAFGASLLAQKRILLEDLNQLLKELLAWNWNHFLLQLFRQKKISLDEFVTYRQNKINIPPPNEYRLKSGKFPVFYREVEGNQEKYGSYVLLEELGKGGMGIVYKAYHPELNRFAALKLLHAKSKASEKGRSRFLREVQIMAKLKHENIVQIYDSGEQAGQIYLAMEYVNGKSLEDQRSTLSFREKLQMIEKSLEGLCYSHENKVIHRDLKLENILLMADLTPKLADFGLAKELDFEQEKLTESGVLLGTAHYMAPEQVNGCQKEIDEQTDVYAMGICLYRLLTQKFPFEGKTLNELLHKIVTQEPIPPSKHHSEIHRDIDFIVLKALEKEKSERYKNARAVQVDIHCILEGIPLEGKEKNLYERIRKWRKKHKKKVFLCFGTGFLFVVLLLSGYLVKIIEQERAFQKHYISAKQYQEWIKNKNNSETTHYLLKTFSEFKEALKKKTKKNVEQEQWEVGKELILKRMKTSTEKNLVNYLFQELSLLKSIGEMDKNRLKEAWQTAIESGGIREQKRFIYWINKLKHQSRKENESEWKDALYEIVKMSDPQVSQKIVYLIEEGYEFVWNQEKEMDADFYEWLTEVVGRMENKNLSVVLIQVLTKGNDSLSNGNHNPIPFYKQKYLFCILQALGNLRINAKEYEKLYYQLFKKIVNIPSFQKRLQRIYKNLFSSKNVDVVLEEDAEKYFDRANKKVFIQDYVGALSDYTQAIRLNPQYDIAYNSRGLLKESIGDLEGALMDYTEAARLGQHSSAYSNRGNIKQLQGDLDGAILDYNKALQIDPQNAESYNHRGLVKEALGDFDGAILDYNEALRFNPQDANIYYNRGNTKQTKGDLDGAILDYTDAIRLNPKFSGAHNNRGLVKRDKGDLDGAIFDFTEAVRLNPQDSGFYNNRGDAKQATGAFDGAILDYNEVIRLNPNAEAYNNRGHTKQLKSDLNGAIQDFTDAIRLNPQDVNAYLNRAGVQLKKRNLKEAKEDYKRFLELTKNFNDLHIQQTKQQILQLFPELAK